MTAPAVLTSARVHAAAALAIAALTAFAGHAGDLAPTPTATGASKASVTALRGRVASLEASTAQARAAECQTATARVESIGRFMRQAAVLSEHVAAVEAKDGMVNESTIDFERSTSWPDLADSLQACAA